MDRIYRSKVDTWLGLILGGLPIAASVAAWQLIRGPIPWGWMLAIPVLLLGAGLPVSLLLFTTYRITDECLRIRSGIFTWTIPIQQVTRVEPTSDPTSSPALSMDRLRIEYGPSRSVLVSPADREEFLRDLRDRGVPPA